MMRSETQYVRDTIQTGTVASAATTVAAAICGQLEEGRPIAPLNAVSHIVWGDKAALRDEFSGKYTLPGVVLNTAAVLGWAGIYELMFGGSRRPRTAASALAGGALVSTLAYVTDYYVVPQRLTPGFEKRLSNKSLAAIYATLAVSLGVGSRLRSTNRES